MFALSGPIQSVTAFDGLWLIALGPALGAVVNLLLGRWLQRRAGVRGVHVVAIGAMALAVVMTVVAAVQLFSLPAAERFLLDRRWELLSLGNLHVDFAFALDPLAAVMALVITIIGTLIHVYSIGYMHREPAQWRFFGYLNLFVFAMLLLVLGDSLLTMFFGWEGVGLASYLLIGFWYEDAAKARAAKKAFVTNRVGDWGFVMATAALFWGLSGLAAELRFGGVGTQRDTLPVEVSSTALADGAPLGPRTIPIGPTLNFRELRDQASLRLPDGRPMLALWLGTRTLLGAPLLLLVWLGFFLGAAGKSAQLPLFVWLPDAMAGPTPVSALIHAATMVTAGVYMMARLSFLLVLSPAAMTVVACAGAATALVGAVAACVQTDIKRVLAYSTISQLGFMFLAVGSGAFAAAVFHLVTHACFKACLFLAAGSTIHGVHYLGDARDPRDPQDLRNMGGLGALLPRTRRAYLLGCVALAGLPIASGFYSKDEILGRAFAAVSLRVPGGALFAVGLFTAGLTAFYAFRSYYLAFAARPATAEAVELVHESPASMTAVLTILGGAAVVAGPLLGWPAAWGGHPLLERVLAPVFALAPVRFTQHPHIVEWALQATGVAVAVAGWWVARMFYREQTQWHERLTRARTRWGSLIAFSRDGFGFDAVYRRVLITPAQALAVAAAFVDRRFIDGLVSAVSAVARAAAIMGGALDHFVVDGVVNSVAQAAFAGGRAFMRLQTGRIGTYVLALTVGLVALVILALTVHIR